MTYRDYMDLTVPRKAVEFDHSLYSCGGDQLLVILSESAVGHTDNIPPGVDVLYALRF